MRELHQEGQQGGATRWSRGRGGGLLTYSQETHVSAPAAKAFDLVRRIGGANGWYYANWLWRLRGVLDGAVGGAGLRGRRDPDQLAVGEVVDYWRVEVLQPGRLLRLYLEMKQPGEGWLEFEVEGNGAASSIRLTAMYAPAGLLGRAYWWLSGPLHRMMFAGVLRSMAAAGRLML